MPDPPTGFTNMELVATKHMSDRKRQQGAYYTERSPFELRPFQDWAKSADLANNTILEPFAGANNLARMLRDCHTCHGFASFDLEPTDPDVMPRDTLEQFPTGYRICITNPPWLARNSARRRGLAFPTRADKRYDDIYKYALDVALSNCPYAAFIIPATFIRSGLFRDRLESFVLIEQTLFYDTDNPVCLALFVPKAARTKVWADDRLIGDLDKIQRTFDAYASMRTGRIRFNAPDGRLGLLAVDNTREPSIRFCHGFELAHRKVQGTDRAIVRIDPGTTKVTDEFIDRLNDSLDKLREDTHDLFLAPFKGLRADGRYRRRLDFATARGLIGQAAGRQARLLG